MSTRTNILAKDIKVFEGGPNLKINIYLLPNFQILGEEEHILFEIFDILRHQSIYGETMHNKKQSLQLFLSQISKRAKTRQVRHLAEFVFALKILVPIFFDQLKMFGSYVTICLVKTEHHLFCKKCTVFPWMFEAHHVRISVKGFETSNVCFL